MPTELRAAWRKLVKSPGFALTAILTLALSIGANTTIFSLVQGALLTPPPFPQPDRLVALRCKQPAMSWPVVASLDEYFDWKEQTGLFSDVMVYNGFVTQVLADDTGTRPVTTPMVSANFLRTLGLRPLLGRDLTEADNTPGAAPVALVSHQLWKSQLHSDPGIIGRTLRLGSKPVTIVGVLPESFISVTPGERPADLLMPLSLTREPADRGNHYLWVYARLQDGVSLPQAAQRMNDVALRRQKEHDTSHGIITLSLQEWSTRAVRPRLLALMGAVALVLLIACVNLANLQLVRITGRTAEISIKMALGAGRGRIARELLGESLLLGLAGGALGVLLAAGALSLAGGFLKTQFAAFAGFGLGLPGLFFSAGITLLAVALSSLLPAWRATAAWDRFMRAIGRSATATPQQRRLNHLFIVAQVALTLLVLVSAGLLVRSLHRLLTQDRGFTAEHIAIARVALPPARYGADPAKREQFFTQLLARLRALPGITDAASGDGVPLRTGTNGNFSVPGLIWTKGQEPLADKITVSPGFYRTFGIPLLQGRDFDPTLDRMPTQPGAFSASVIVNEAFAKKYYGDRDPVGQRVSYDSDNANAVPGFTWDTIIGVVGNARTGALDRAVEPAMYVCYHQSPEPTQYIAVRSPLDAASLLPQLREQVRALDPELSPTQLTTMQVVVDSALAQRRLITWTVGGAAGVALALAMLGLYSVISYTVAQQTREIGVRMALGARPETIGRWILARGLRLVTLGILLGLAGSYAVARLLGSLVYDVSAWDPLTYGGVVALLATVALLACWLPARRAARIDPLEALRTD